MGPPAATYAENPRVRSTSGLKRRRVDCQRILNQRILNRSHYSNLFNGCQWLCPKRTIYNKVYFKISSVHRSFIALSI
jgi:hypothetical protein